MRFLMLFLILIHIGCSTSFLEVKSDKSSAVPYLVSDYQALLDDASRTMNTNTPHLLGVLASDELIVDDNALQNPIEPYQRNAYAWRKDDFYEGGQSKDWNFGYRRILYCNIVLDGLDKIDPIDIDQEADWNNAKGSALFFRALTFYQLAQLFCPVYDEETASGQLGLSLRTDPDVTMSVSRSTLQETYDFILHDLHESEKYLPEKPLVKTRPSKSAIYGALARIYLQQRRYDLANTYARKCLAVQDGLIDYNDLDLSRSTNITFDVYHNFENNPEIIFYSSISSAVLNVAANYRANEDFFAIYGDEDLRKRAYFRLLNDRYRFVGSYTGRGTLFSGLATDEILLILAETEIRNKNTEQALTALNRLRRHRYAKNSYVDYAHTDEENILQEILLERKRNLVFRGIRWEDIRRLNAEGRYPVTIERDILGEEIKIQPNDSRYVFPLSPNVIDLGDLEQNPR